MGLPIFAITLFVSAFLLFLVQPLIGKLILPKLGGTPQVWNTCMVFFQSVLLLGYAYTHWVSTKLKLRQQLMVHGGLLLIPILVMGWQVASAPEDAVGISPFYNTVKEWVPPAGSNPIPQTLLLLAMVVGIPFFVVSTSAPLLQRWFAYSGDPAAKDPYFLYGASNLGSLLSLFFYPALMEPFSELPMQSTIWFGGYIVLAGLVGYCAFTIGKVAPPDEQIALDSAAAEHAEAQAPAMPETPIPPQEDAPAAPVPAPAPSAPATTGVKPGHAPGGRSIRSKKGGKQAPIGAAPTKAEEEKSVALPTRSTTREATGATAEMTNWRRVRWVLLAAVPSSLMLGVTSYISTDLSPFPLVWVGPLALYLISFILVYMKMWTSQEIGFLGALGFLVNKDGKPGGVTWHDATICALQPLGVIALCFIILSHGFTPFGYTLMAMLGFFGCALACHGELAKDRPATKYLTEYFLMLSVGGMLGGLFNGIIAPVLFQTGVWEFHAAIIIACVIRPQYVTSGWFDDLVMNAFPGLQSWFRNQGDEMAKSMGRPAPRSTYLFSIFLDVVFGFFILSISYYLSTTFASQGKVVSIIKFLSLPLTDSWVRMVSNILVIFLPLSFCFFFAGRPLRLGLAVTGLMLGSLYFAAEDLNTLEARRTYFGVLRVRHSSGMSGADMVRDPFEVELFSPRLVKYRGGEEGPVAYPYTFLMHGTTYHGRNYYRAPNDDAKDIRVDLSRLATTYYHRYGPVGYVMEQYNWWSSGAMLRHPDEPEDPKNPTGPRKLLAPTVAQKDLNFSPGRQNDYTADMRMPASLVGQIAGAIGVGHMPILPTVVDCWSEPPIATIGLGTGTMASYARPYGHMTYYEIDDVIRHFSLPDDGGNARFTYLQNAIRRGVNLEVIMGDARQALEPKREKHNLAITFAFEGDFSKPNLGEKNPYADAGYKRFVRDTKNADSAVEAQLKSLSQSRDNYYKVINVDAFSSDAIPVHLVTKQAIEIYMNKLTQDGVLCIHTSNRHMDLVRPVARIALELGHSVRVGKDGDKGRYMGHFSSEYVMISRGDKFSKYLDALAAKKKEFIKNRTDEIKGKDGKAGGEAIRVAKLAGKLMMHPIREGREEDASFYEGNAPAGWQMMNASVVWYDPFQEHTDPRYGRWHKAVTNDDSLWTDDYTYILGLLR